MKYDILRLWPVVGVIVLWPPVLTRAADGDDTLRHYISKAELVIIGVPTSTPVGIVGEVGVVNYRLDLRVPRVIKGSAPNLDALGVRAVRFEFGTADKACFLQKDAACIFFLVTDPENRGVMMTADPWFGVQPFNSLMEQALVRMVEREKKKNDK